MDWEGNGRGFLKSSTWAQFSIDWTMWHRKKFTEVILYMHKDGSVKVTLSNYVNLCTESGFDIFRENFCTLLVVHGMISMSDTYN